MIYANVALCIPVFIFDLDIYAADYADGAAR